VCPRSSRKKRGHIEFPGHGERVTVGKEAERRVFRRGRIALNKLRKGKRDPVGKEKGPREEGGGPIEHRQKSRLYGFQGRGLFRGERVNFPRKRTEI